MSDSPGTAVTDTRDRPLRDLRISVTDRCNFRCPYCMPADVFHEKYRFMRKRDMLTVGEITRLARLFGDLGVRKFRLTGGEPLLWRELPALITSVAALDCVDDLTLTTNGSLLAEQAQTLKDAGLQRITISLDSLDPGVFRNMCGRELGPESVLAGIDAAGRAGLTPVKINCVVQRGVNDHTIVDLARHFRGTGHILRFIEYMDVGTINGWQLEDTVAAADILARIDAAFPLEPAEANYRGEVARRYRYRDGAGEIGVIASVSAPFCGDCTRARLSADGSLLTCLFGSEEHDLREPMRGGAADAELRDLIARVWGKRADRYSEERTGRLAAGGDFVPLDKVEMFKIGG